MQVTRWIPPTLTIPQWMIVQIQDHPLGALNGGAGGRDNINSAEFSVTPYSQDPVDTAKTITSLITEK